MNTLERNRFTDAWRAFGQRTKPRAILAISAHWETNGAAVTAMARPRTIHDFGGFPAELFAVTYPSPGLPDLADRVAEIVQPTKIDRDLNWGLDHGTWSVLAHMYPDADVPVVQLSLNTRASLDEHLELGAALAPLREEGVLIVASGNVVHNLRLLQWNQPDASFDWAEEFDEAAIDVMVNRPADAPGLTAHHRYSIAAPSAEHFLPLLYIAGLASESASASDSTVSTLVTGQSMGSLSMTSFVLNGTTR